MATVHDYQRFRAAQQSLNTKLLDSLPQGSKGRSVINGVARELGYKVKDGTIVFPRQESLDRLSDSLIYDPGKDGKSAAQRCLEKGSAVSRDEEAVLRAAVASETSLYEVVDARRSEKRLLVHDLLRERDDLWAFDVGFSRTVTKSVLLFARVFTVGDVSFFSGGSVCFDPELKEFLLKKSQKLKKIRNEGLRARKRFALFIDMEKHSGHKVEYW